MVKLLYLDRCKPYVVICNNLDNNIISFLHKGYKSDFVIEELQSPDNTKIQEIKKLVGGSLGFYLSDIENNIRRIATPTSVDLHVVAMRFHDCMEFLRKSGKSENALVGAYYKFLSWLRFEFANIIQRKVHKDIQYWGSLNTYSAMIFYIVGGTGLSSVLVSNSDIDNNILKTFNIEFLESQGVSPVKSGFRHKDLPAPKEDTLIKIDKSKLKRPAKLPKMDIIIGTNMWLPSPSLDNIFTPYIERNIDGVHGAVCSAFIRVNGVEDKTSYISQLYSMYEKYSGITTVVNSDFKNITPNELTCLRIKYKSDDFAQYIMNLCGSLNVDSDVYTILVTKLTEILYGVADNKKESMLLSVFHILDNLIHARSLSERHYLFFLETEPLTVVQSNVMYLLSCIMFDVVIFNPNGVVSDVTPLNVFDIDFKHRLLLQEFPVTPQSLVIETVAYNAENELTDVLYDGSAGIYRDNQFKTMRIAYLKPMNEEIDLLWSQAVKFRQGFKTENGIVTIPTVFAEILGVKNEDIDGWNTRLTSFVHDKSFVFYNYVKNLFSCDDGYFGIHSASVMRSKKIDFDLLSKHERYPYSYLNPDKQRYMVDKLQELLDSGIISGVYTHGVENDVLAVFGMLNNFNNIIRMIQNFDFTKINPKFIYVWMEKDKIPKYDVILMHYLNMLGFDVLVLVPTNYNVLDAYVSKKVYTEYQEGNGVEPFIVNPNKGVSVFKRLFGRR